ncbi:MAG: hypothetical protein HQL12_09360, partial [Candidatus Omnitrophica bacterium]|nr:hypothetical protein [Candidatus Omnitrophota bacterium]
LATWYKKKIKDSILAQMYADKNKIAGVNIDDPNEKQRIYERYLRAFKKGVYNYIKEEPIVIPDMPSKEQGIFPRKYFSGGVDAALVAGLEKIVGDTTADELKKIDDVPPSTMEVVRVVISGVGANAGTAEDSKISIRTAHDTKKTGYERIRDVKAWAKEDPVGAAAVINDILEDYIKKGKFTSIEQEYVPKDDLEVILEDVIGILSEMEGKLAVEILGRYTMDRRVPVGMRESFAIAWSKKSPEDAAKRLAEIALDYDVNGFSVKARLILSGMGSEGQKILESMEKDQQEGHQLLESVNGMSASDPAKAGILLRIIFDPRYGRDNRRKAYNALRETGNKDALVKIMASPNLEPLLRSHAADRIINERGIVPELIHFFEDMANNRSLAFEERVRYLERLSAITQPEAIHALLRLADGENGQVDMPIRALAVIQVIQKEPDNKIATGIAQSIVTKDPKEGLVVIEGVSGLNLPADVFKQWAKKAMNKETRLAAAIEWAKTEPFEAFIFINPELEPFKQYFQGINSAIGLDDESLRKTLFSNELNYFFIKARHLPLVIDHLGEIANLKLDRKVSVDELLAIVMARGYVINIKLARYLVIHPQSLDRIDDENFKKLINEICSEIGLWLREDSWAELFDFLFAQKNLTRAMGMRVCELLRAGFPLVPELVGSVKSIGELSAIADQIRDGKMDEKDPVHVALNYSNLLNDVRYRVQGAGAISYEDFKQMISNRGKGGLVKDAISERNKLQIRGLAYEAYLVLNEILRAQAKARALGKRLIVIENESYGPMALASVTEKRNKKKFIRGSDIEVWGARIGSTESSVDAYFMRSDLFTEDQLKVLATQEPMVIVVDGSKSVDLRILPHIPDAVEGYRNAFMAINKGLTGVVDPEAFYLDQDFVDGLGETSKFSDLVEKIKAHVPQWGIHNSQGYKFGYWYPGKKGLYARVGKKTLEVAPKINIQDIQGPTVIFIQSGVEPEAVPINIKDGFIGGQHIPVYFDDTDHYKNFYLVYEPNYGIVPTQAYIDYSRKVFDDLLSFLGEGKAGAAGSADKKIPIRSLSGVGSGDKAMRFEKGGIDLTNLITENTGGEIKFHTDAAMIQQFQNALGFVPVIINIQPMTNLRQFLGLNNSQTLKTG